MPVILRIDGYKFFFFSNEGTEPIHVHVERSSADAKFWLGPVRLARNNGLKASELSKVRRLVEQNEKLIEGKWHEFFSKKN